MEKTRQNWTLSQHAQLLTKKLQEFEDSNEAEVEFNVEYTLEQTWLNPAATTQVKATFRCAKLQSAKHITVFLEGGVEFDLSQPVKCLPVTIPKQWGKEIWYSGIEARGESQVAGKGGSCSLATYLSLAPSLLHGNLPVTLIKVLDPSKGDMYLEVHKEKQEVYIVSHIDNQVWPNGSGGIRLGINQETRNKTGNDDKLRKKFIACTKTYERLRKKIDANLSFDPVELSAVEVELASFTRLKKLHLGDVVKIPTWVPHSLQRGVRVVEFQTPTYERLIIAASQKVVTQPNWDSEQAIANLQLDSVEDNTPETAVNGKECIAQFEDFAVYRITVTKAQPYKFPEGIAYAFVVAMSQPIIVAGLLLISEEVCFLPGYAQHSNITSKTTSTCLVTLPKKRKTE